jgi:iron complex outermembrane receptor protein
MKTWIVRIFLSIPLVTFAQEKDSLSMDLPELLLNSMVVNDSVLNTPVSISVWDEQEILSNNSVEVSWILNKTPGVFMQSGSINTNRISIRGLGARTPYGTNKIRGFYGNIPLTSGDSETTIEDLDLEQISQMEIIKGPMSSIYGAGLGGAILLHPKLNRKRGTEFQFSTTIGSFDLMKNNAGFSWTTENSSINYGYSRLQTDGFRENSDYFREGHTLSGIAFQNDKHQVSYLFHQTYLKSYIPSSINQSDFENNPHVAAANWREAKGFEQYHNWMGGMDYEWKMNSNLIFNSAIYFATKDAYEPRPFDILEQNTETFGGRIQFLGHDLFKLPFQYVIGGEIFQDNYDGKTYENLYQSNNGNGSLQGNQLTETIQDRFFYNFFAQIRIPFWKKWEVQAGLNWNQTQIKLEDAYPFEAQNSSKLYYDPILSPQISLMFHPIRHQSLYASFSRGYSYPAIEEMLNEEGRVNTAIQPEVGNHFEIGYKLFTRNWNLEIAAYHMEVEDLLVSQRVAEDQYVGVNAGKTLHQGIEIYSNYRLRIHRNWHLIPWISASFGNYEFKEFKHNGNEFSGNELTGVPPTTISGGLALEMPLGFRWTMDYYFVDKFAINDANTVYNESYQLLNTKIEWQKRFFNQIDLGLSFGINNLMDERYASMVLVNATAFGNAQPRYYYPGNPFNCFWQIRLKINI